MTTITREQQKQILIDTANHVISRDNTSPYSENLRELARIALASLEAEPIGAFHIADQQVGGTSDYIKDGEWPIDNGVIEVYAAPPATVVPEKLPCSVELKPGLIIGKGCKTEALLTALRRRAEYYAKLEAMTPEERAKHGASIEAFKAMLPQPAQVDKEFIPKNLDKALGVVGVVGVALPESKEEFNFQIERWIQRLIDRVIRYADEFKEQPVPVVPEEMNFSTACNFVQINGMAKEDRATLAMRAWNACRAAMINGGKS
ncbi:Eaa protein [Salmonella enterica subsp. enterica serovar Bareilly]